MILIRLGTSTCCDVQLMKCFYKSFVILFASNFGTRIQFLENQTNNATMAYAMLCSQRQISVVSGQVRR